MLKRNLTADRWIILVFLLLGINVFTPVVHAQNIERVDPPFWYKNMRNPELQLLILLHSAPETVQKVRCEGDGINVPVSFEQPQNRKYLILNLKVPSTLKDSVLHFQISMVRQKGKPSTLTLKYRIKERLRAENTKGVGPEDFIYLLMPDRFSNGDTLNDRIPGMAEQQTGRNYPKGRHGGDIRGMIQHLDYLKGLGVTALWPTPVFANNEYKESYHGYAITDHYAVDPRLGNLALYDSLRTACERNGMKLIKDVIYNHVGDGHYLFRNKPDDSWFNHWDTFTRTHYKAVTLMDPYASEADKKIFSDGWFDHHMPDLNQRNPVCAAYLIQNTLWWIETFRLNGLRIDTYSYPDQDFMKQLIRRVLTEYPSLGIFGETWVDGNVLQSFFMEDDKDEDSGLCLPGVTDFQFQSAVSHAFTNDFGWNQGLSRMYHILAEDKLYQNPMRNVIFLDNHDMSRFYSVAGTDTGKMKMALGILMTFRGIPCVYYGTEILMRNFSNPDALVREDFPGGWKNDPANKFTPGGRTAQENRMHDYLAKLGAFRMLSEAIKFGKTMQFVPVNGVYVYFRFIPGGERVMVILNQNPKGVKLDLSRFSEMIKPGETAMDAISSEMYTFEGAIEVQPMSILILKLL